MTGPQADAPRRRRGGVERWLRAEIAEAARSGVRRAIVLGALASALAVPQAWLLAHAIAPVVMAKASVSSALPWLLPVLPLLVLRFFLATASGRAALAAAGRVKARIRSALLRHLASLGPATNAGRSTGEAATVVLEGVDALDAYVSRFLAHLGVLVVLPPLVLVVVLPRDWISGLVLLVTAPVIPLFMVLLGLGAEKLNRRQWLRLLRLSGRLLDGLQRLTTLRLLNAGDREAERLAEAAEDYRKSTMAVLRVAFLSTLALEFFATVGIALVAVLIGFRLLDGALGFEAAFFVLLLAPEFYAPLRQLGLDYHARMEALAAAERILDLQAETPMPAGEERPVLGAALTIECEGVSFAWEPERPALQDFSLRLVPGEIVALVGPSGAGKSTLLSLLMGLLHPQSGQVLANGHDLATLDPAHWLEHVAVVPQRPHMFEGSVLDNIRLGDPDASLDRVRAAARMAAADGFITALPRGYDTPLGEHGETLSGGQVQRLALARAFLKEKAGLLLLDEGTAGLDRGTEASVADAIRRLATGRTTLIVTHRLATVHLADRVVFLEEGRIVEQGPRAALQADDGRFARLLRDAGLAP
ncbi:thiol reductant ABC exporter subunit CydD [Reyranella sp.]|jgi:ATP-binding cassette subfamily C protein CydD|uniref:thiol reductant ABC exporter subunit CydD n=1 Tax=Reyranella sp. TaxID=1929291 RepID=UPI000BD703B5|nr:thiol reductant ABC exporter subunit CydD [Reyranella sp.]OYY34284.1 MAG: thiol reductant ABC exporter subunit CydD [Rhodospirillales bacterium 35-66-84]OYZ90945.1 MAG: thiol reductant ABC exporter subunit CydD [Rhodospirillales bacterium 24-66-33]OZB21300.1 MAG: thiol reductant ABC exporter subunit CydD [Rhodospirillales bacterium 39-66-50]HQS19153.1 thiol reductant ABC exporter subunit CydD [Reyranella sp.]HQT15424.1 thiol reductant ABC exporter subunit CydD [Reyranella sp.]